MQVDLNLLTALDALIEHESVQGAAAALHITPPAMSHTLRRLRVATGDDILVRNGRRMVPTPRAFELREDVRELVERSQLLLSPRSSLDLSQLERTFTIRGNEALLAALAAPLLAEISAVAPGVLIVFLGEQPADSQDLARGIADIEIGGAHDVSPNIRSQYLGEDNLAVIMRDENPLARSEPFGIEEFAGATHVVVSRRGKVDGPIDEALTAAGLRRRVVASLPTTTMALDVVEGSDAITVVAGRLVRRAGRFVRRPLPLDLPPLTAVMTWHRRHDSDAAHRWLRSLIGDAFSPLFRPSIERPIGHQSTEN